MASNDFTLPPNIGGRATRAVSIPGALASIPNPALPVTLSLTSVRATLVPMIFQSLGSLSVTVAGTGMVAALSASAP